ncbi:MAG: ribosome biogenesis GTPase Der [Desulfobacterales bacterium]|jgi:GTP-binding protein|nr:ribosome biogenesis GTPase Der [Desulfobacterales bacterium]
MKPVVAIVGRPNSGKSTLFNRITKTKDALVDDFPGVTRDRHYGSASWNGTEFTLVDTGGFCGTDADELSVLSRQQVMQAIEDADAVVLLLDGRAGVSPYDHELMELLRNFPRPVFYTVNKIDGSGREPHLYEFYNLGVDALFPVSAEDGYGMSDFLDALTRALPAYGSEPSTEALKVAVIGRPNVGKSSLINRILGEERAIVSEIPGTTRDAIDTPCSINGKSYLLIDTAGIRRKKQVSAKIEKFSIIKALKSIDRCDIALIVLDAQEGVTEQDVKISGYAYERGCACIFIFNKWDLVKKDSKTLQQFVDQIRYSAKYLNFAPVIPVSALTGKNVAKIFQEVELVHHQYATKIATGPLNKIFEQAVEKTEPAMHHGKRIRFYYTTQIASGPPTFVCFVNYPEGVHFSYQRYLVNQIREAAGLDKTPIRLFLRKREEKENRPRPPSPQKHKGKRRRQ